VSLNLLNIEFSSKYVQLSAMGFYFNEGKESLSNSQITLLALVDISTKSLININVLTDVEIERVKNLFLNEKKSFAEAKNQALKEVLKNFDITENANGLNSESFGLTSSDNRSKMLLAISSIFQKDRSEGDVCRIFVAIQ
jgi:hypothetical protein